MSIVVAAWSGLAGIASGVTLLALVGAVLSIALLRRLRADLGVAEAAERFEAVDLTSVVKRYVPGELQTNKASEEIPLAKQAIVGLRRRWTHRAMLCGVLLLCAAAAATLLARRNLVLMAAASRAAPARINTDTLAAIRGVWGWRADFLQSCAQNPQTITLSLDAKKLSIDYAKPYWSRLHFEFAVISTGPNTLVMRSLNGPTPGNTRPSDLTITFLDLDTILVGRSDQPLAAPGAIERCPAHEPVTAQ